MKMLSGLDGVFLHLETPAMPMHVGSLSLLEAPAVTPRGGFVGSVRRLYERRLHLAPVVSRKLHEFPLGMANPVWVQVPAVDLDYHIRHVTLPAPGTLAQLEAVVGALHSQPLDRGHPLWTVYVIEGLQDGRIAFYTNIHHAVVDGQAGVELMRALFDLTPRARRPAPPQRRRRGKEEQPWAGDVIAATVRHDLEQYWQLVRDLPALARSLASPGRARGAVAAAAPRLPALGPRTPLNVAIDGQRGFATASISLAEARALAAAHEATVNDVVLAACAGALRRYLGCHGGVPDEPLVAGMPISLHKPGKVEFTTQATMARVGLATQIADPLRRLRAIRDASAAAKARVSGGQSVARMDFPTIGVPWLLHGLSTLYGRPSVANRLPPLVNVVVSNVPGPPQPLYLAGARVLHHWPLSIVGHGLGLNITVESYAGMLEFGITAASVAVPRPRSVADSLVASFRQLQARTRGG
ncbi:MAG: wax ester/triacylglycerol synthase family O-acyltransferase [Steroidobacteraceae bacterium]|nr:wax ester/triacylglycerol synthase family O-acyltransferase [Steroidobacteraceae bacterium]